MARQTNTRLREKVIYSVFVRNHTKEGTFQALEGDLDRLAALGTMEEVTGNQSLEQVFLELADHE